MKEKDAAVIFNIQHYSLHDGPGIRTAVFFKGCPMRCRWCCNPESQSFDPEISYIEGRCIGKAACGWCAAACPSGAVYFESDKVLPDEKRSAAVLNEKVNTGRANTEYAKQEKARINFKKCTGCQKCVKACPAEAIRAEGQTMEIAQILDIVERDQVFYARGKGGLTVSGGEVLAQPHALAALLFGAKKRYIHTAMETCGQGSYDTLAEAAQYLDALYYDIKMMNCDKHQLYTGFPNEQILSNLKKLCMEYPDLPKTIRTPVIPGVNDTEEEIHKIYAFVKELPGAGYELLPYHSFGQGKYHALGRIYEMGNRSLTGRQKNWIEQWNRKLKNGN